MIKILRKVLPFIVKPLIGKVEGLENIPDCGAVLIANHASYLDHYVIGTTITPKTGRDVYFLAKKEHFSKKLHKFYHQQLKAIPLDRETGGKGAMKKAVALLQKGELMTIYPEGTRTLTGKMNRAKPGAAKLALSARVPVVPMAIKNTFHMLPKGKKMIRLGKRAELVVGQPIYLDRYYGHEDDRVVLQTVITIAMKEVANLLGEEYGYDLELVDKL